MGERKDPYRVSDALWAKIEPLLPKHPNAHRFGGGRPRVPDRQAMDGAMTKAPLGGEKNRPQPHGPGQKGRQTQPAHGGVGRAHRGGR